MKYIEELREGERIGEVYLCKHKQTATTKAGKPYDSLILQDKTGTLDAKIWDVGSSGIEEFKRVKKMSETDVNPSDYLPVSEYNIEEMYQKLLAYIAQMKHPYLKQLAESFFADADFAKRFQFHSAAKSVHHGFVGGLVEHTLHVTQICDFFSKLYPMLNRDLLLTAAMFHDIGKLTELSTFPANDYTDDGQLLGHIMIGAMEVQKHIDQIEGFPKRTASELIHCILAHHGELEYGSPKKPALAEAIALSFADNSDAKLETMREALSNIPENSLEWQGFNRFLDSNIRRTSK